MNEEQKNKLRESFGLKTTDYIVVFVAELSERKNQEWLINSSIDIINKHPDVHYLLIGQDSLNGKLQNLVKELGIENNFHFLGRRSDVPKILKITNMAVSSSKHEGLPVNIMEDMCAGLPIIATNCRGNRDLIKNEYDGLLVNNKSEYELAFEKIYNDVKFGEQLGNNAKKEIEKYTLDKVMKEMVGIYENKK